MKMIESYHENYVNILLSSSPEKFWLQENIRKKPIPITDFPIQTVFSTNQINPIEEYLLNQRIVYFSPLLFIQFFLIFPKIRKLFHYFYPKKK